MTTILLESMEAWTDHRASSKSAALAFFMFFSMTPILILAIAIGGYFFGVQAAQGQIVGQIQGVVGPNGAQAIQALLAAALDPVSGLVATIIAIVLLVIGSTSVFVELKDSLDEMWGVAQPRHSAFATLLRDRLLSFILVLVLAFLLLVSLLISAALPMLGPYLENIPSSLSITLSSVSSIISFSIIACLFAVIYKMLPDAPLSWRDVWIGAVFTAALFILGKYVIGLYLGSSSVASSFGAAGSVIALLLWIYYSALIFFFGAEFTRQYALRHGSLRHQRDLLFEQPA